MVMRKLREQHGETGTILFRRWTSMRNRVSPKWKARARYYDRGIGICTEWEVFSIFKKWALENGFEEHLELDRKDNDKGYYPENCRWITHKDNSKNREDTIHITINGVDTDVTSYCESIGIDISKIHYIRRRIQKLGWDHYTAVHTPRGAWGSKNLR